MRTTEILSAIDEQIARLQQAKNLLSGYEDGTRLMKSHASHEAGNALVSRKLVLCLEGRKRIADAQRKRWAEAKKTAK